MKGANKDQRAILESEKKKADAALQIRQDKAKRTLERKQWAEDEFQRRYAIQKQKTDCEAKERMC